MEQKAFEDSALNLTSSFLSFFQRDRTSKLANSAYGESLHLPEAGPEISGRPQHQGGDKEAADALKPPA